MWTFQILAIAWFGYEVVTNITRRSFDALHRLFFGLLLGLLAYHWVAFILSGFTYMSRWLGYLLLIFFGSLSYLLHKTNSNLKLGFVFFLNPKQKIAYIVFAFIAFMTVFVSSYYGFQTTTFPINEYSVFLSMVSSFSIGANSPRQKIFKITTAPDIDIPPIYPFMPSFVVASLTTTGRTDPRTIIVFIHTFLLLSIFIFHYGISYVYSKSHVTSIISVFIFMLMGGIGWTYFHSKNQDSNNLVSRYYTTSTFWKHTIFEFLIANPNHLWGTALSYATILILITATNSTIDSLFVLASFFCAALAQSTPSMLYGLIVLSILIAKDDYLVKRLTKSKLFAENWSVYFIISIFLAIVISSHNIFFSNYPTCHFQALWNAFGQGDSCFSFWFKALGIFILSYLIFGIVFVRKDRVHLYINSVIIFVIFNYVIINKKENNLEILYATWVPFACAAVATFYSQLLVTKGWISQWIGGIVFAGIMFSTCASGFIGTAYHLSTSNVLTTAEEYKYGLWLAENINKRVVILPDSTLMANPASVVAGRAVAGGNIWMELNYYHLSEKNYSRLLKNPLDYNVFSRYQIYYVQSTTKNPWIDLNQENIFWKVIFKSKDIVLYRRV
ncbi:hypothetical protein TVAG_262330 [Trichomonas vaginalis G3]|uniref:Uncharacterized protein n=1 Tax=Trichomonas vaginalis (strain ATCC PRA-98 / G3) TaxID=412133 RepID=A2DUE5_TRIV3|nr:hypothetical protein TVAGG3_0596010 [Trichomonas vaginalis G3]EAY15983.1 hypothetical protein TVAG_262330 [Trichomonas vaginalis G3]KAI5523618.1 hypothetical protein TVAGG3_0596010 [Trichomonas vaginalis G3]|eukprot:XP_001328206.1 hypothetical protein [Trichomonas vaginalis G3]